MTLKDRPYIIPQIQVTLDCNFDCNYCFQERDKGIMDIATVDAILKKTVDFNKKNHTLFDPFPVVWHGGEPLIAGKIFFERVLALESRFKDVRFQNRVQTNGSLMTKDLARFFTDHHFHLGFSLDGPRPVHNQHRRFRSGGETFDAVMKGMNLFKEISGLDRFAVIAVVTRQTMGRENEFFEFFKALGAQVQLDIYDLAAKDFAPDQLTKNFPMVFAPDQEELGKFLIRLFDLWFYDATGRVDFNELRNDVRMILMPELDRGDPVHKKRCDPGRIIFDPRGRAFSCDQYVNDDLTSLGHICHDSIEDIMNKKIRLWEEIKNHIRGDGSKMACNSCVWGRRHMGGCITCMKYNAMLLDARSRGLSHWKDGHLPTFMKQISGETYYCNALKTFRAHAEQAIKKELGTQAVRNPAHG